jgi:hypothetical protein
MNCARKTGRSTRVRFLEIWRAGRPELVGSQINRDRRLFGREVTEASVNFHDVLNSKTQLSGF